MSISSLAAPTPPETIAPPKGTGLSMVAKGAMTGASYGSNLGGIGAGIGAVGGAMHSLMKFKKLQEEMRQKDLENKKLHAKNKSMLRQEGQSVLNAEAAGTGYFQNMYSAKKGGTMPEIKNLETKDDITKLQKRLVEAGYDIGNYGKNKNGVDGILGKKTKEALSKFAKENTDIKEKYFKSSNDSDIKSLQKRLISMGYDLGTSGADGIMGPKTENALEEYEKDSIQKFKPTEEAVADKLKILKHLPVKSTEKTVPYKTFSQSQHKIKQTEEDKEDSENSSPYKYVDSKKADIFRTLVPAPSNISQMLAKTIIKDARMSNESLTDDQKIILWEVIRNAQKRSGIDSGGGTEYSDYGGIGYGDSEDFNKWFNKGKIDLKDGIVNSLSNPAFTLASTIGRGRYWVDEKDPNVIMYTDVYDWNAREKNFKEENAYQKIRNKVRAGEDKNLNADKNENYRMNFRLSKKEIDKIRERKASESMMALASREAGGQIPKHFLGNVISTLGSKVVSGIGSTLLNQGKKKLAGMAGDVIAGAAGKATEAIGGSVNTPTQPGTVQSPSATQPPMDDATIQKIAQAVSQLLSGGAKTANIPAGLRGMKLSEEAVNNLVKMNSDIGKFKSTDKPKVETDENSKQFRDGGSMSVIPRGVLHTDENQLGDNGIPVVIKKKGGEFKKVAEIEKEEIIFSIAVTKELEKYAKKLENGKITDEELIRVGNLVKDEVTNNTVDITGEML